MSEVFRLQSANGHVIETDDGKIVFVVKTTVPADGLIGYIPGAIAIIRNGSGDTSIYINRGSLASSLFKPLGNGLPLAGGTLTGPLNLTSDFTAMFSAALLDGAITQKSGMVYITKASAAALTIADPTATVDDGKVLTIISTTAAAHTISNAAGSGFNVGGTGTDVGTLGGAKGDNLVITAYQGKWYVVSKVNCTLG